MLLKRTYHFLLILGFATTFFACQQETIRIDGYEVHGLDVSRYQGAVDWNKVVAQNIDFVFIKATEGNTLIDSQFHNNWKQLSELKVPKGAYHFFRPTVSSVEQAKHFTALVKLDKGDLPPVLDIEITDGVSKSSLINSAKSWIEIVERSCGMKPIIYTSQKFYNTHLEGYFDDHPLWIARYNNYAEPAINGINSWTFWQYGNQGRIDGIDGDVDFNVFRGNSNELDNLTAKPSAVLSFNKR